MEGALAAAQDIDVLESRISSTLKEFGLRSNTGDVRSGKGQDFNLSIFLERIETFSQHFSGNDISPAEKHPAQPFSTAVPGSDNIAYLSDEGEELHFSHHSLMSCAHDSPNEKISSSDETMNSKMDELIHYLQEFREHETSRLEKALLARGENHMTALAIALKHKAHPIIEKLLELGSASSIFVRNIRPKSLLCTLPCALHSTDSSDLPAMEGSIRRSACFQKAEDLHLLDRFLSEYIRELSKETSSQDGSGRSLNDAANNATGSSRSTPLAAASSGSVPKDSVQPFEIGDRVRLRPKTKGSSLTDYFCKEPDEETSAMFNILDSDIEDFLKSPSDEKSQEFNKNCLGSSDDLREGVIVSIGNSPVGPQGSSTIALGVASVHTGRVCLYAPSDLMFADGIVSPPNGKAHTFAGKASQSLSGAPLVRTPKPVDYIPDPDWGKGDIASSQVSSGSGASKLFDGDPSTFWQSDASGSSPTHHIELSLTDAMAIKDLSLIFEEQRTEYSSYTPEEIRLSVWDSSMRQIDLGTLKVDLSPTGKAGPKVVSLLQDYRAPVSKISINMNRQCRGGYDCRVHGVIFKAGRNHNFLVGDYVELADGDIGEGWNLAGGSLGIVTCTPYLDAGDGEGQRCIIVSSPSEPRHFLFRGSSLQRPVAAHRFALGDVVRLNDVPWPKDADSRVLEAKCLGPPRSGIHGTVTDTGFLRGGVQRNIEVTVKGADGQPRRSLYSAHVLKPYSVLDLFPEEVRASLIATFQAMAQQCSLQFEAEKIVDMFRASAWSRVWGLFAEILGHEKVFQHFVDWQNSRYKRGPSVAALAIDHFRSKASGSSASLVQSLPGNPGDGIETAPEKAKWECQVCAFKNTGGEVCRLCKAAFAPKNEPWSCQICGEVNDSKAQRCSYCFNAKLTKVRSFLGDERPLQWTLWAKEVEKELELLRRRSLLAVSDSKSAEAPPSATEKEAAGDEDVIGSEAPKLDPDTEETRNRQISGSLHPLARQDSRSRLFHAASMLRGSHGVFFFQPLDSVEAFLNWRDRSDNLASHHVAYMGLKISLDTLIELGASRWDRNKFGTTPAALLDLGSLANDRRTSDLHEACVRGDLFLPILNLRQSDSSSIRRELVRRALLFQESSSQHWYGDQQGEIGLVAEKLKDQRQIADAQTLLQMILRKLTSWSDLHRDDVLSRIHARSYHAIALLAEGRGEKAARLELKKYLAKLLKFPDAPLDPVFFLGVYRSWHAKGKPRSGLVRAVWALRALKCFPRAAQHWSAWMGKEDTSAQVESILLDAEGREDDYLDDEVYDENEDSGPEKEWQLVKERLGLESASMDQLMGLTGLNKIKRSAMTMLNEVLLRKGRPQSVNASISTNMLFLGNPGCGKTTAAKLLAGAMNELGFRNKEFVETSAQRILKEQDPPAYFQAIVQKCKGGVVFIDEAYRFTPAPAGSQPNASNEILDHLLEVVEDPEFRKSTTFILAGYKDEIETLLTYNIGFASRFPLEFVFDDFTETQLKRILVTLAQERGMRFASKAECGVPLTSIIAQRVAKDANSKGFGNARSVRNKLEDIIANQTQRLGKRHIRGDSIAPEEYGLLTREDTIGPAPDFSNSPLLKELDGMAGLKQVKKAVRKLIELQVRNFDRELAGDRPERISLHRVFYGNPGTGKSTVVRIYGALLKQLGLLSKGDFLSCTPADLTGDAVGAAATKTKAMLEKARGKVLFIDEAYILDPKRKGNTYGGNVLDVLVEKLEGEAGSDIAVILAGYKQEMFDMLENNPGLRRRFNIDDFGFHFEDMNDEELRQVLISSVRQADLVLQDRGVEEFVVQLLSQKRRLPNFGNAGTVKSLLNVAKVNKAARISAADEEVSRAVREGRAPPPKPHPDVLIKADFEGNEGKSSDEDLLGRLHNIDHIRQVLFEIDALIVQAKSDGKDAASILSDSHMVFTGPPGTGKTTVARTFGQLFHRRDLMPSDNILVTTGTNLQGQYVGETKEKVLKILRQARGGILFVDEAYGLAPDRASYATEAVDTLVGAMTEPEFKGNLLVIMAGYADKIDAMFSAVNPGFRSRFDKRRVDFPPWTGEQAAQATVTEIEGDGKSITERAKTELTSLFVEMARDGSWASARDVYENIVPALYSKRASRLASQRARGVVELQGEALPYELEDVVAAFQNILGERILQINDFGVLQSALDAHKDKLVVIDMFAEWCGPCKKFTPVFAALKKEFKSEVFIRTDIDGCPEASEYFEVDAVPNIVFYYKGNKVKQISGADGPQMRKIIRELLEAGRLSDALEAIDKGSGQTSNIKTDRPAAGSGEPQPAVQDMTGQGSRPVMSERQEEKLEVKYDARVPGPGDDDFPKKVLAALEQACKELEYSLDQILNMLSSPEKYSQEVLKLVMKKTQCNDESKIREALDPQHGPFLQRVKELIAERERVKDEEEKRKQEKIRGKGLCPMGYDWLKVQGGYQCAGGSHFISDADLDA